MDESGELQLVQLVTILTSSALLSSNQGLLHPQPTLGSVGGVAKKIGVEKTRTGSSSEALGAFKSEQAPQVMSLHTRSPGTGLVHTT